MHCNSFPFRCKGKRARGEGGSIRFIFICRYSLLMYVEMVPPLLLLFANQLAFFRQNGFIAPTYESAR
jgi:hypothetical protein